MKFTFKNAPTPTGLARVCHKKSVYIKLKGSAVGSIENDFTIRLMVVKADINEDGNPNCPFKWVKLSYKPDSFLDAKEYLNANFDRIYKLNIFTR